MWINRYTSCNYELLRVTATRFATLPSLFMYLYIIHICMYIHVSLYFVLSKTFGQNRQKFSRQVVCSALHLQSSALYLIKLLCSFVLNKRRPFSAVKHEECPDRNEEGHYWSYVHAYILCD